MEKRPVHSDPVQSPNMLEAADSMKTMAPPKFSLQASGGQEQPEGQAQEGAQETAAHASAASAEGGQTLKVSGREEDGIAEEAWAVADDPAKVAELEQQPEAEQAAPAVQAKSAAPIQRWNIFKAIGNAVSNGISAIGNGIKKVGNGIVKGVTAIGNGIKTGIKAIGNGIKGAAKWVANGAKKIINGIQTGAIWLWGGVKTIAKAIGTYGWNVLKSAGSLAWDFFTKAPGRIWEVISHLGKGAAGFVGWLWTGIKTTFTHPSGLGKWFVDGLLGGAAWTGRLIAKVLDVFSVGEIWDLLSQIIKVNTRTMTKTEISEARKVFGGSLPYGQIRIDEASIIAKIGAAFKGSAGMGVTTAHTINFNRKISAAAGNGDMAWLIHELTHVAQYEAVGLQYLGEAIYAQSTAGYSYGGPAGIAGKSFSSFNREQQGDIASDYYHGCLYNNSPTGIPTPADKATYQPLINDLAAGKV